MLFESFASAQSVFLGAVFVIALIMGAVVNKTNFCTMGAVSDWVNMGDKVRLRAWLLAIAVALIGVVILESMAFVDADGAFPPYRNGQLIWAENLLGGILFGIGMTLASGCGNKALIRVGGGNLKSVMVVLIIAVVAYYMINPFPNSDQTLFTLLFYDWIRPLSIDLAGSQDLGTLVAGAESAVNARLVIGLLLGALLLLLVFRSADFRGSGDNILGGLVVGLAVLGAWYVTSNVMVDVDDEPTSLSAYVQNWEFLADTSEGKPADSRPLNPQSFTFINPMAQAFGYTKAAFDNAYLTFGVVAFTGVILGSLLWALIAGSFRLEWFASAKDFLAHFIGAILMGIGGVLAMGCTIGQAITGVSTLAVGSFVAFAGIIFGSALTMKIQYYKLVYEDEASFFSALSASLADMKLLPGSLRKLEKV
ncbi:MAG: YeeE/YedE family protein [Gammaproteobacteria bacterium]